MFCYVYYWFTIFILQISHILVDLRTFSFWRHIPIHVPQNWNCENYVKKKFCGNAKVNSKMSTGDIIFIFSWVLFCLPCFLVSLLRTMVIFWGSKKIAFQIWRVKGQHKSVFMFILTSNIWADQNEKSKYGSWFKYTSFKVVFDFYHCDCAYTWIQIWWNFNIFYVKPDFKFWHIISQFNYIEEFQFEKLSTNLKSAINKSLKKNTLKSHFPNKSKQRLNQTDNEAKLACQKNINTSFIKTCIRQALLNCNTSA